MQLTEEDGEFHLVMSGGDAAPVSESDLEVAGVSDFEFRMSFTFPGSIIESSGGEVDGNTVTYTDVGEVSQGIDIRAEAGGFPWLIIVVEIGRASCRERVRTWVVGGACTEMRSR